MSDLKYWVAFSRLLKLGPARFKKLLNYFPDLETAFSAPTAELKNCGLEENLCNEIVEKRKEIDPDKEWILLEQHKIKIITIKDPAYPKLLKEIYDPPPLLFYRGNFATADQAREEFNLGVVGSRRMTPYGQRVAEDIVSELTRAGMTIISGLAYGIDATAHRATINNKGKTIGVLASGLDEASLYPQGNLGLAREMIEKGGAIISEFPIGTTPQPYYFPFRNRIISGLSLGVLVIEAAIDSGALITGRCALDQNREVFAIPGDIYSSVSQGPNSLIKLGAKLVINAQDILEALNLTSLATNITVREIIPETAEEEKILAHLSYEPIHVDQLVLLSQLDAATANSTLLMMEMKGKVKNLGGMNYVIAR